MSKNTINLVNEIVNTAEKKGVARLINESSSNDGKNIVIDGLTTRSFGSYSYLALEIDARLKKGATDYIEQYGIQYPTSRIYTSLGGYQTLEGQLEQIFGKPVVLTTSLSLGHSGVLQVIVEKDDLFVIDQSAHSSIYDAVKVLKSIGVEVSILRHNELSELERILTATAAAKRRVWYAIDGIYSMYGDLAPIERLEELLNQHSHFYLYADDAHGVSSFGKHGSGWVLSKMAFHDRLVLATGMAKAFGTMGGVFTFGDRRMYERARNCTGSLIFSGPHPVPILGASIASASIHLSEEIHVRQQFLAEKISYCSRRLKELQLPDISDATTPIFFIALGILKAGHKMVHKLLKKGFYVNLASFPAVSESCTGIRFTITLHHTIQDIDDLLTEMRVCFLETLEEEQLTVNRIRQAFRKVPTFPQQVIEPNFDSNELKLNYTDNLLATDDSFKKLIGNHRVKLLMACERSFKNLHEHLNWKFHYIWITDKQCEIVIGMFLTDFLSKDDMLSEKALSEKIELLRKNAPTYLCSRLLMSGNLLTDDTSVFIKEKHRSYDHALTLLFTKLDDLADKLESNRILLRSPHASGGKFRDDVKGNGYLPIELPSNFEINAPENESFDEFIGSLSKRHRKFIKDRVLRSVTNFSVEVEAHPTDSLLNVFYELYGNVHAKSRELNTFKLPRNLFSNLFKYTNDFELISLKNIKGSQAVVAIMLCQKGRHVYTPLYVGLDYSTEDAYSQILYQSISRGFSLGLRRINLGLTSKQIKRKFGAQERKNLGFVKSKDNLNDLKMITLS